MTIKKLAESPGILGLKGSSDRILQPGKCFRLFLFLKDSPAMKKPQDFGQLYMIMIEYVL